MWHVLRDSHEDVLKTAPLALEQLAHFDPAKARSWGLILATPTQEELDAMDLTVEMITGEAPAAPPSSGQQVLADIAARLAGGSGGSSSSTLLRPSGGAEEAEGTPLRLSNREDAVREGCRRLLYASRRRALDALKEGFGAAKFGCALRLWSVEQLCLLASGSARFDGAALLDFF